MNLPSLPASMVVVGSAHAIGSEFAGFYRAMGTEVTLVEFMPRVLPIEDECARWNARSKSEDEDHGQLNRGKG